MEQKDNDSMPLKNAPPDQSTSPEPFRKKGWVHMFFTFHGRLNRLRYFLRSLLLLVFGLVFSLIVGILTSLSVLTGGASSLWSIAFLSLLVLPVAAILLWINLSLNIRRVHDLGYSGTYYIAWTAFSSILSFFMTDISYVGIVIILADLLVALGLLLLKGEYGPNRFGSDPLQSETPFTETTTPRS